MKRWLRISLRVLVSLVFVAATLLGAILNFPNSAFADDYVDAKAREISRIQPLAAAITLDKLYYDVQRWFQWQQASELTWILNKATATYDRVGAADANSANRHAWLYESVRAWMNHQNNNELARIEYSTSLANSRIEAARGDITALTSVVQDNYVSLAAAIAQLDGASGGSDPEVVAALGNIQLLWGSVTGENCLGKDTLPDKFKCLITREFQQDETNRMIHKMREVGEQTDDALKALEEAVEQGNAEAAEAAQRQLEELQQQREAIESAAQQAHNDAATQQGELEGIRGELEAMNEAPGAGQADAIEGLAGGYADQFQERLDTWTAPVECVINNIQTGECGGGPTIQLGDWFSWQPLAAGCELLPQNEIGWVRQLIGISVIASTLMICITIIVSLVGIDLGGARAGSKS